MEQAKVLPPDPEGMNDDRAGWAELALETFMAATGADEEDALCDLLADLRHWADRQGLDWESEIARADMHYEAETAGECPECGACCWSDEELAKHRLEGAAGDLADALEEITRCCRMTGPAGTTVYAISDARMDAARAAVKKARG